MYIILLIVSSFVSWTGERQLILGTAKKGILALKYGPNDLMLWKRGSAFLSRENENLWSDSSLMWFGSLRPPEMLL